MSGRRMAGRRAERLLRPAGFDELGLRRAISDRMLPFLVAAMGFLAALALSGWVGAAALAHSWQAGAEAVLTVQVPQPDVAAAQGAGTRLARVVATLRATPGIAEARPLGQEELARLLRPWLGAGADRLAVPLPAVIAVRLADGGTDVDTLTRQLSAVAPGTLTERHESWMRRLAFLARSVQACAAAILLLVASVAATVIAVATRAGLSSRREAIEIVHLLGATDGYIAGRFSARATLLAMLGGAVGALVALPVMLVLANLAAPLAGGAAQIVMSFSLTALPAPLWLALPSLPLAAAAIGCLTAQITVRRWLRHLP
ncbi:MAG TPA: FtsX-like permease family protein [Acetobacteraceae bacterium]|nr:FtsX-like permease family protein [Acetobacteraceae bacterium]